MDLADPTAVYINWCVYQLVVEVELENEKVSNMVNDCIRCRWISCSYLYVEMTGEAAEAAEAGVVDVIDRCYLVSFQLRGREQGSYLCATCSDFRLSEIGN